MCLTCIKAARELPSRPLWLFDSPLLRQALAQADLPAVPAIVRAARGPLTGFSHLPAEGSCRHGQDPGRQQ